MSKMTSAAEVADLLRERILSGEIPPGRRLQQIPLSEELAVSRTPLREALALLARDGLLDYEPNRGYAVREFRLTDVIQAFEARGRLEALAASLCARNGLQGGVLDRLSAVLADGDKILSKGMLDPDDLPAYRMMNVEFHETILEQSGNRWVVDFVRQCQNVPLASNRVFIWDDFETIKRSHDDHHRILAAIRERDAERADYIMREHILYAGRILRNAAQDFGNWSRIDRRRSVAAGF
ncbi:GntR family transcriptional regulator [Microvirga splendida]|uniref:GntR family transcriptional regulator n=1 Tax=Microvirga splendida TaxID=2795727 RepID=A0ABS0Y750_9HYPH|nr:GntR family transcriptional regulator [Microvirga splendida]MBJ6128132.1 GntR family transcriptional regulator [Microvirga splendida]